MNSNNYLLNAFTTFMLTEKRVTDNTFYAYQSDISQLIVFLEKREKSIETAGKDDLKAFLRQIRQKGFKARTMSRKISSLKLLYSFLSERHNVSDISKSLLFPKLEKTLPLYLSEQEIQILFKAAGADKTDRGIRNRVMLSLLYASGMRISEMIGLRIGQINFQTGFVQLTGKGSKERSVPLPHNILQLIRYYLDTAYRRLLAQVDNSGNFLFFSIQKKKTRALTRQAFWIILKKLIGKAGITKNISPHSLRHSLATHLLKNGANLRTLQLLLGHENVSTVEIYTHLENSQLRLIYDTKHPRSKE